jgi:hypothetical protein
MAEQLCERCRGDVTRESVDVLPRAIVQTQCASLDELHHTRGRERLRVRRNAEAVFWRQAFAGL